MLSKGRHQTVTGPKLSDKTELLAWILSKKKAFCRIDSNGCDRRHDIIGAVNNGIRPVGVLYGYDSKEELIDAGAMTLCEHPTHLMDI